MFMVWMCSRHTSTYIYTYTRRHTHICMSTHMCMGWIFCVMTKTQAQTLPNEAYILIKKPYILSRFIIKRAHNQSKEPCIPKKCAWDEYLYNVSMYVWLCETTRSCMWHASFIRVTCILYLRNDTIFASWRRRRHRHRHKQRQTQREGGTRMENKSMRDMTHSYVPYYLFICVSFICGISLIHSWHMPGIFF